MPEPWFDPVAIQLGPLAIRWYGLAYFTGIIAGYLAGRYWYFPAKGLSLKLLDQLMSAVILGIIIGGRMGAVFIYYLDHFLQDPLWLFKIWQGGMSFHGALVGVLLALVIVSYRHNTRFWVLSDFVCLLAPVGLFFGRIANFINGELVGRVTTVSWGVVFPHIDNQLRHPSQLYEAMTEGVLLFILLVLVARRSTREGTVSRVFLLAYGCIRFVMEYFREPDMPFGLMWLGWDMGQWLSAMMVVGSLVMFAAIKYLDCEQKNSAR